MLHELRETYRAMHEEMYRAARQSVAGFTRGGLLDLSTANKVGRLPIGNGGTGNNQGAAPHALVGDLHTVSGLTTGDVLTATGPTTFGFAPPTSQAGSAWGNLVAVVGGTPEIVYTADDVVMVETYR